MDERNITLLSLWYFKKTADLGHLSRAAEALHVAQPGLSRAIANLEEAVGARLFDRTGRGLTLNPAGEILLRHANAVFRELDDALRQIREEQDTAGRTVRLSVLAASRLVPELLGEYKKLRPDVLFHLTQQGTEDAADLILSSAAVPAENDNTVTLLEEELLLAMPRDNPLSAQEQVNLSDFAGADFISLQGGKSLRTITDTYCRMAGFAPRIVLESDSPSTVREFIASGFGVAFVPAITWPGINRDSVALRPIRSPNCRRFIRLSWSEEQRLSPVVRDFRDFFTERFAALANGRR